MEISFNKLFLTAINRFHMYCERYLLSQQL